ncbi:hypothetical protein TRFO_02296 [Tritrichomonas foetus]|uniref:Phosphoprotein phosphatase n=1 Tax=Tritrichomonas foetus TaxID=1144522 RepID=A0A1J4J2Y9_9EUKA|nr:hypothetical protein TRFO_02296 [Tritrichomonas foetus]|eukprot:OHS93790.1 hypothetical protein TRFO_02296 [Tritrichomonas foetus]
MSNLLQRRGGVTGISSYTIRHPSPSSLLGQKLTRNYCSSPGKLPPSPPQPKTNVCPLKKDQEPLIDCEMPATISIAARTAKYQNFIVKDVPHLPGIGASNFDSIYREKMKICSYVFNFQSPEADKLGKNVKLESLIEIESFFQRKKDIQQINNDLINLTFDMIYENIFDQDPFVIQKFKCQCEGNIIDPSWVHLTHVFNIFQSFFSNFPEFQRINIELAKKTIILLNLPDKVVRDAFLSFLNSYVRVHTSDICDLVVFCKSVFQNIVDEIYSCYCASSIINFLTPIYMANKPCSDQLISVASDGIFQLFRCNNLTLFSESLCDFIRHVLENERELQDILITRLLRTFPTQNGTKQIPFINAMISVLKIASSKVLQIHSFQIINFLEICIESPNSKVAEAALSMWTGHKIINFLIQNNKLAISELLPSILIVSSCYWNKKVQNVAQNALSSMKRINTSQYSFLLHQISGNIEAKNVTNYNECTSMKGWALIFRTAAMKDNTIDLTSMLRKAHQSFVQEMIMKTHIRTRQLSFAIIDKTQANSSNFPKEIVVHRSSTLSQTLPIWKNAVSK